MKTANRTIRIILAIILTAGVLAAAACSGGNGQPLTTDSPAPDFSLKDLNGNTVSLSSLKGKAVFLNFWATTCPPCVAEMPHFQELHKEWADKGIVMLLINTGENAETVKNFIQSNNYTFTVLLDTQYEAAQKYLIQYTPTSFFINEEGRVKLKLVGAFKDKAAIEKQLASFIP